ncbi:NUDIX domain-containing protein [Alkalibaculum sp. M08DMB]|uniref:NUDIX domain-containing protein n=1 Tax=Alkalibaculum sporogenes TaxID=2655001 RepID=A0A6A7K3X3_9FIRM|nr:CoA pyrophosphatase [Alkalibaculum sporogenes]MPW24186.1 NUDIX domain-containing protein [Alkalibaculum sporogenes]
MNFEDIKNIFEGRKSKSLDIKQYYGVLVPIIEVDNKPHLLYQVRSFTMRRQPGEISFPGGKIEEGETSCQAALRETKEEMGIQTDSIDMIGELDYLLNNTNDMIYPFLGYLRNVKFEDIKFSSDEVSEIFTVPIDFFINNKPEVYDMSYKVNVDESFPFHKIQNSANYQRRTMTYPVYFYEYSNYIIWGLTAQITRNFIKELRKK